MHARDLGLTHADVDAVVDFVCTQAHHQKIFYLWRPFLRDPNDDMVLEVAVEAQCSYIVTFNTRDFAGIEQFGLQTLTPGEFLALLQEDARARSVSDFPNPCTRRRARWRSKKAFRSIS